MFHRTSGAVLRARKFQSPKHQRWLFEKKNVRKCPRAYRQTYDASATGKKTPQ